MLGHQGHLHYIKNDMHTIKQLASYGTAQR